MFELIGFLVVFIVGASLVVTGLYGTMLMYECAGRVSDDVRVFIGVTIVGIIMVVLVLLFSPYTVVRS